MQKALSNRKSAKQDREITDMGHSWPREISNYHKVLSHKQRS